MHVREGLSGWIGKLAPAAASLAVVDAVAMQRE
jgi:hypothetical protein